MALLGIIYIFKYVTIPLKIRTLLSKAKGILNYEIKETIEEVKRNAVFMVNLKETMERESEEIN